MIRRCESHEIERIHKIINMAAEAYREVIPLDRNNPKSYPDREYLNSI